MRIDNLESSSSEATMVSKKTLYEKKGSINEYGSSFTEWKKCKKRYLETNYFTLMHEFTHPCISLKIPKKFITQTFC